MNTLDNICTALLVILGILIVHRYVYVIVGLFCRKKQCADTSTLHKYAIIIAARNEEAVIGNLLDSIHAQSYDQSLLTVFVVADNCTDGTASVSRRKGARVYERFDIGRARKGYALEFLFNQIKNDYGIDAFDGYFFFDADNLLSPDYIQEMNKMFAAGNGAIISYRNTKNFDTNFISAASGIHFLREAMTMHRPRSYLGIGSNITGTGFLLAHRFLADGWSFHGLTEDSELTAYLSSQGVKVAFCDSAEFYDEQPVDIKNVCKQRIRWIKGLLTCFISHGGKLLSGIIKYKSFTCYDLFTYLFPYALFSFVIGAFYPVCSVIYALLNNTHSGLGSMPANLLTGIAGLYLFSLITGSLTVIVERKRIHCATGRLIVYTLLFPLFELINIPLLIIALFTDVKWHPVEHKDTSRIEDLKYVQKQAA